MKLIRTEDAVGQVLCHDLTRSSKGSPKAPGSGKGILSAEEDIPVLLSMGNDQLYVGTKMILVYHEMKSAQILCQVSRGENMIPSEVREARLN